MRIPIKDSVTSFVGRRFTGYRFLSQPDRGNLLVSLPRLAGSFVTINLARLEKSSRDAFATPINFVSSSSVVSFRLIVPVHVFYFITVDVDEHKTFKQRDYTTKRYNFYKFAQYKYFKRAAITV